MQFVTLLCVILLALLVHCKVRRIHLRQGPSLQVKYDDSVPETPLPRLKRAADVIYHEENNYMEMANGKPHMKPDYGVVFNHQGYLMQNLRRIYLVVAVPLPDPTLMFPPNLTVPSCENWYYTLQDGSTKAPGDPLVKQVCKDVSKTAQRLLRSMEVQKRALTKLVKGSLPALLPNPIVQTPHGEAVKIGNQFWYANNSIAFKNSRQKRAIPILGVLGAVNAIAGTVIKGINSYINYKRNNAMQQAIEKLSQNDEILLNQIKVINNKTTVITRALAKGLRETQARMDVFHNRLDTLQTRLRATLNDMAEAHRHLRNVAYSNRIAIKYLSKVNNDFLIDTSIYQQYYTMLIREIKGFLSGVDTLAEGILSSRLISPEKLHDLLHEITNSVVDNTNFELVFKNIFQYYAEPIISFTNSATDLIIQIPVLIKKKNQEPLQLFSMQTVPFPLDSESYTGQNNQFTQIQIDQPYMATNPNSYIPLTEQQLRLCTKIQATYYCENAHLLIDRNEHSCASALFFNASSTEIVKNCDVNYIKSDNLKAHILDAGESLILSNLPKPWTLICYPNLRPVQIQFSTYRIVKREELCECSLSAGPYYLSQTKEHCENSNTSRDGIFESYYAANHIVFDYLEAKLHIQLDSESKESLNRLLDGIPEYNWAKLNWIEPDTPDNVIQNEKDAEIVTELDVILEKLIEDTDQSLFRSTSEFLQNQKSFKEHLKSARKWEAAATIGSFLSYFNILVWILLIFFGKNLITKCLATVPIMQHYELAKIQTKADDDLFRPNLHYPTFPPEHETISGQATLLTFTIAIIVFCTTIAILYCIYKKYKYSSSLMRTCFPCYPLSRVIRGNFTTDIFVEITHIQTAQTIWAHVQKVTVYPSRLRVFGTLQSHQIQIQRVCCGCTRIMRINWQNVIITDDNDVPLRMSSKAPISIWTPSTLESIMPDEAYTIRIMGRVLDLVMELPTANAIP